MTEEWQTITSHPASGLAYQGRESMARVIQNGHEIVSPSGDTDSVYKQYQARYNRHMSDSGHPDYQEGA